MSYSAAALFGLALLMAAPAHAAVGTETCTIPISNSDIIELEQSLIGGACTSEVIDDVWDVLKMEDNWWNSDWGFDVPCDLSYPLSRALTAGYLIRQATPRWWWYVEDHLEKGNHNIRPGCYKDEGDLTLATTYVNIYLWMPILMTENAVSRASTIVHETRHTYKPRTHSASDDDCVRGGSCDERWSDNRSNTIQVEFLSDLYCSRWDGMTPAMRQYALDRASPILERGFEVVPPLDVFYGYCLDTDGDGIPDIHDNCREISNSEQLDADGDGDGDVCDCGPNDPAVHRGAPEICDNGVDENCDSVVDGYTRSIDGDGDGIPDDCDDECDKNMVKLWWSAQWESGLGCFCPDRAMLDPVLDQCVCNAEWERMDPEARRCVRCEGGQEFATANQLDPTCACPGNRTWDEEYEFCVCQPGEILDLESGLCVDRSCDPALGQIEVAPDPSTGSWGSCTCAPPGHPDYRNDCIM